TYTPMDWAEGTGVMVGVGRAYELKAVYSDTGNLAQVAPGASYSVVITYTAGGAAIEDTLALYYWDGAEWITETTSQLDTTANTVSAAPSHLSKWAILGQTHRTYLPLVQREG
ncbi:MAG: hypothetical protein JW850_08300, partial [Thermoflexales bacterium]|nr:hypothetical protein [Thermoflexales bacterium]